MTLSEIVAYCRGCMTHDSLRSAEHHLAHAVIALENSGAFGTAAEIKAELKHVRGLIKEEEAERDTAD